MESRGEGEDEEAVLARKACALWSASGEGERRCAKGGDGGGKMGGVERKREVEGGDRRCWAGRGMTPSRGRKGGIAARDSVARIAAALGLCGRRARGTGAAGSEGGVEWEAWVGRSRLVVVEVGRGEVGWGGRG